MNVGAPPDMGLSAMGISGIEMLYGILEMSINEWNQLRFQRWGERKGGGRKRGREEKEREREIKCMASEAKAFAQVLTE